MGYPFALVLHTHLPMVVNHGRWPHGSDWLCEAAFECYLPLLEVLHRLVADGISPRWSINLSPVLTEQLASPEFQKELAFYRENVLRACAESREHFTREGDHEIVKLTYFWEYFLAASHLIAAAAPVFLYRDYVPRSATVPVSATPEVRAPRRSPYHAYRIASRGGTGHAVAFFRDPRTTLQVWSREHGYPGDYAYLEFHKKHHPGGLRFWRITDNAGNLGTKQPYDPAEGARMTGMQARHFVELVRDTASKAGQGAVVCSPYDAELFGHCGFEGPPRL